jgi:NitT/TauT family transport system substrate-binding protein
MKRRTLVSGGLVAAALVASGNCRPALSQSSAIRIGHSNWIGFGPLYIAQSKGFYKDAGVDVELSLIENMSDTLVAIAAGRMDGIANTIDAMILANSNGLNLRAVVALDESAGGDGIVAKKEIESVEQLRGKKIGVQIGSISQFLLAKALDRAGMKLSDVEVIDMRSGDAGAAFVAGQLDAAVTWQPWLSRAKDVPFGKVLVDSREFPGVIVDALGFREDVVKADDRFVEKFVEAYLKGVEQIKENRDESMEIMAKGLGMTRKALDESWSDIKVFDKARNQSFFGGVAGASEADRLVTDISNFYVQAELLKKKIEPAEMLSPPAFLRS